MAKDIRFIDIDGSKVPIEIIAERRSNARVALGGKHVILRIPKTMFLSSNINKHLEWASQWLLNLKSKKPEILQRYVGLKEYKDEDYFTIGSQKFFLEIEKSNRESGHIKLNQEGVLRIQIHQTGNYDEQKLIKNLLIKFCQKYFLPTITERVHYYNNLYFKKQINGVRLKYNKSNWGSCSTGKNLNFSVRLFFAPPDVIDYVIVHELAHLLEMNHSDKFWNLVKSVMPDYKHKEKLLKQKGSSFDF